MRDRGQAGANIGGTAIALAMVPIVVAAVAIAVGFVITVVHVVLTVIRPEIIGFIAACLGGCLGVAAARGACDAVLKRYAPRVVFVELLVLCLVGLVIELTTLPMEWGRAAPIAQLVAVIVTAHGVFWRMRP
jgi:hypothetical protein